MVGIGPIYWLEDDRGQQLLIWCVREARKREIPIWWLGDNNL